jgi:hypothetical protein
MLVNDFYNWLLIRYNTNNGKTADSIKSRCLRVEALEGDLDTHYKNDKCRSLIEKLSYSADDERHNRQPKHKIQITGNKKDGTATLKQAVNLYINFKMDIENGVPLNKPPKENYRNNTKTKKKSNWPTWELPSDEETYQLAQIVTKYIRFLNPNIIKAITEDNMKHYKEWRDLLLINKVNPDLYLWELSPCCFPGVRRYAGSKENAYLRRQIKMEEIPNALRIDDNDFPKQIWSFVFRGKQFGKFGPNAYSLAHLFDHKEAKNRMKDELEFIDDNNSEAYFGLYTCPTNTVYIPNALIKPTDFNPTLRGLLFQKTESLYKGSCNILPPSIRIPSSVNNKWEIENFQWADCVGILENINDFLDYRCNKMKELMEITSASNSIVPGNGE